MTDFRTAELSRRRFLALTGGAGLAASLAACGGGSKSSPAAAGNGGASYSGPAVTIGFWNGFTGGDQQYIVNLVNQFNQKHPNIKVQMSVFQWADFNAKLPVAVNSGKAPQVAAMHVDDIPTNAARGVVVPVDDVAKALGLEENDFSPVLWKGSIWNGKRYGIPLDIHPLGMYYNKDVLEKGGLDPDKPPQTHDEYMSALDALKAKGIQGHWAPPFLFTGTFQFESILWQNGGQTFSDDAKTATFDSQAGIDAMTWLRDLVTKGYSPANVGQDADYVAFKQGKNAFCWNGIWQVADADKAPGLKYGVAPIPQIGSKQKGAWTNSHMFTLVKQKSNDTNKMAAAQTFINWISTNSLEWAKSGKVPARASVRDSAEFKAITELQPFAEELPYVHFPALAPGISDAAAQIDIAVSQAILGKKDPASALHAAASQANKVLKDNASKYGT